ncbi:hypothetical protein BBK36DRAFT_1168848 [Trichoderma citrinoviride]|uniref:Apple domain-containing protein n=1 Tax=Trichoderma citrinoviride TaxID=58853 RepID=A0A2T4BAB5_9HYPO|nr:hypothetical protein BBK36DRAFT_1168848 [Trichoderma citrinoviride]PTB66228.1 hypothetical protein BBK36DRAFT_1168848 [Trichoderma citrinoviride]
MVKINSVVSLLALGSGALAFGHQPNRYPVEEYVTCSTKLGPQVNRHVQTHWNYKTRTVTFTERYTTTPHPTVTPTKTKTKTITSVVHTVTTEPTVTDVATITSTIMSYSTTTNIVTEIDTETDTTTVTTTPTTTIPAPADFTPIAQEPGFVPRIKGRSAAAAANSLLERGNSLQCKGGPGGPVFWPPMHPQSVTCTKFIEPIVVKRVTYTARACTRTARPKTKTVTTTLKQTQTETVFPADVTSTVMTSTTSIVVTATDSTTTTTTTTTATESVVAPQETFQAVCGPENLIYTANGGNGIAGVSTRAPGNFIPVSGTQTPYDCCTACFSTAACRGSLFYASGSCYLVVGTDGVCHANQFVGIDAFQTLNGASTGTTVSNGPCGMLANGGSANY